MKFTLFFLSILVTHPVFAGACQFLAENQKYVFKTEKIAVSKGSPAYTAELNGREAVVKHLNSAACRSQKDFHIRGLNALIACEAACNKDNQTGNPNFCTKVCDSIDTAVARFSEGYETGYNQGYAAKACGDPRVEVPQYIGR